MLRKSDVYKLQKFFGIYSRYTLKKLYFCSVFSNACFCAVFTCFSL